MSELTTPLYDRHVQLGAKMVPFAGYLMPIEYQGIQLEHLAVRHHAGLFDVSHMGEIRVKGSDSLSFIDAVTTNRIRGAAIGQVVYTLLCYPEGTVVDDLLVYIISSEEVLLIVNASNTDKDYAWLQEKSNGWNITLDNESTRWAEIALQGPLSEHIAKNILGEAIQSLTFMQFKQVSWKNEPLIISRTGYTGEDGFEFYGSPPVIVALWDAFLQHNEVSPCGLGCRDTLRFEAALPLYGHEISDQITPFEAKLGFAVKLDKDFIGKDALMKQKERLPRHLVGIELTDKGIARQGYSVWRNNQIVGTITTGYQLPGHESSLALALVDSAIQLGDEVTIQIRQKFVPAVIRNSVFMTKRYKRK